MNTLELADLFLADEIAQIPPYVMKSENQEDIRARLRESVLSNLNLTQEAEFINDAWKMFPVPGTNPKDFLYRLIPLTRNRWIITSIRFRRGNFHKPFIEIVNKTFPIVLSQDLRDICEYVAVSYNAFKPTMIRLYHPDERTQLPLPTELIENDFRFYGIGFADTAANIASAESSGLALKRIERMDFYDEYLSIYERLSTENKLYGPEGVWAESKEKLQIAMREESLFMITIKGQWAGVIAFRRKTDRFLSGLCLIEWVLHEDYRGRGLAPIMLKSALEMLSARVDNLVYAHILDGNKRAIAAAKRTGFRIMGGYDFVKLVLN
jgi:RimJ/RimL family protein N-acetyltransferase